MTENDIVALEAAAAAATPGPWSAEPSGEANQHRLMCNGNWLVNFLQNGELWAAQQDANANYIAAANPAAIQSLIASYRALAGRAAPSVPDVTAEYRSKVAAAMTDLHSRMMQSYAAEPSRRITFMDMDALHAHVAALGVGGCLDNPGAYEVSVQPVAPPAPSVPVAVAVASNFTDDAIERAALKHVATMWGKIGSGGDYRTTDQFARLKAFARELVAPAAPIDRESVPLPADQGDSMTAFAAWKKYPLPQLNDNWQFDDKRIHQDFVAFEAGRKSLKDPK